MFISIDGGLVKYFTKCTKHEDIYSKKLGAYDTCCSVIRDQSKAPHEPCHKVYTTHVVTSLAIKHKCFLLLYSYNEGLGAL